MGLFKTVISTDGFVGLSYAHGSDIGNFILAKVTQPVKGTVARITATNVVFAVSKATTN